MQGFFASCLFLSFFLSTCAPVPIAAPSHAAYIQYNGNDNSCTNNANYDSNLCNAIDDFLTIMVSLDDSRQYIDAPSASPLIDLQNLAVTWCTDNIPPSDVENCANMILNSLLAQQSARLPETAALSSIVKTTKLKPIPNLLIIDDFLSDPDSIREFALAQDFSGNGNKKNDNYNPLQNFRRTRSFSGAGEFRDIRLKIEEALGVRTVNWESVSGEGENMSFQMTYDLPGEFDTHCVHTDQSDWGGVLYLHGVCSAESFYRHGGAEQSRTEKNADRISRAAHKLTEVIYGCATNSPLESFRLDADGESSVAAGLVCWIAPRQAGRA